MRILLVGSSYPPEGRGGTDVHMAQLAGVLAARGHDLAVFCRAGDPRTAEYKVLREVVDGIPVSRVNHLFKDAVSFDWITSNTPMEHLFMEELERFQPDLVHVHHLTCLSTGILERVRESGRSLLMTLHDFWMVCLRGQRITPELEICSDLNRERCAPCLQRLWPHFDITPDKLRQHDKLMLGRLQACDGFITPSCFHKERFLEFGLDGGRMRVIPHGLDTRLLPARQEMVWPPRRVGYLGTVIPSKGVHILVEAVNRLGWPDLELHIHGEAPVFHGDGGYLERLKALARSDLPIVFHGPYSQEELPAILAALDLLVVPSLWWEAFCLTLREAMLAGVPVLASDLGALHEALEGFQEGLLFRPGDPGDLAAKMAALMQDHPRYMQAASLRGKVRDLQAMGEETEAFMQELVASREHQHSRHKALQDRKKKGGSTPYATVFIPTFNGGALFSQVLEGVLGQETSFSFEVLCIDSGSTDETLPTIRAKPQVRLIQIPNSAFNHGLTRNRGVQEARGDVVALLTQDALPEDKHWLEMLVQNFDDPDVAGAYCHQIPREDCNPFQRERLRGWTRGAGEPEKKRLADRGAWESLSPMERYRLIAFDDVASCVRKQVMGQIPFEQRQFGEDVAWAKAAILAGHTLVMDPRAVVIHSHNAPILYEFKRVYLDHQNLQDLVGLRTVPSLGRVLRFSAHLTSKLWPLVWRDERSFWGKLSWTLKTPWYAFTQNLAQYLGARSVVMRARGRWQALDRFMRKGV